MVVWNAKKNRVLYREDIHGNRVYPFGEDKEPVQEKDVEQEELTRGELVELAKEAGIKGASRMKKEELLEALE